MENQRESFVFYRSFYDVVRLLDDSNAKALIYAIGDYALNGVEPTFEDNMMKAIWLPIQPQLEANRRRYQNGKRGGAPKGSKNNPSGKAKENIAEELPQITSTIPSLIDVRLYVKNEKLNVNPEKFYAYYQNNGWMCGSTPIQSWQAMAKKWHSNAEKQLAAANSPLGVGERFDENGNRTYGESGIIVPPNAPRRPSEGHWWNPTTNLWEQCI